MVTHLDFLGWRFDLQGVVGPWLFFSISLCGFGRAFGFVLMLESGR